MAYTALLKNETFFKVNRQFLLVGIVASLVAPALVLTRTVYKEVPVVDFDIPDDLLLQAQALPVVEDSFDFWQLGALLYSIGFVVMLLLFCKKLIQIFSFLKNAKQKTSNGYHYVQIDGLDAPFSFFNYIVLDAQAHNEEELEMIILHEQAHASQHHSVDMFLVHFVLILQWFNPLAWLYKNAVVQNLEYLADATTANQLENRKNYQLALVKVAAPKLVPALAHSFYQSFIKKRIVMLNKQSSSEFRKWKILLIVPVLGAFMWSFNVKEKIKYTSEKALSTTENTAAVMYLTSSSNAEELLAIEQYFETEISQVDLKIQEVQRDASGKITGFAIYTRFEGEDNYKKNLELKAEDGQTEAFEYALSYDDLSIAIVDVKNGITKTLIKKDGVQGFVLDAKVKNTLSSTSESSAKMSLPEIIEDAPKTSLRKTQESKQKPFKKVITPKMTKAEIEQLAEELDSEYNIEMDFSKLNYNNNGEITQISISIKDRDTGNKASASYNTNDKALTNIVVYRSADGTFGVISGQNTIIQRSKLSAEELEEYELRLQERKQEMQARKAEMMVRREEMKNRLNDSTGVAAKMKERMIELELRKAERQSQMQERQAELELRRAEILKMESDSLFSSKGFINASNFQNYGIRKQEDSKIVFVIDGKVVNEYEYKLKVINPEDIESINVLKDKKLTKKYKDYLKEDTEGVIEITTKKDKDK